MISVRYLLLMLAVVAAGCAQPPAKEAACPSKDAAALLDSADRALDQARFAEAEQLARKALEAESRCPEGADTSFIVGTLGLALRRQGRFAESEVALGRSLAISEKVLGSSHPETGAALLNYGLVFYDQRKYSEAERYFRRSLAILTDAGGAHDRDAAISATNLGLVLSHQGKYAEAEPILRSALAVFEKAYGPTDPMTANGLENLGVSLNGQGRSAEAEAPLRRALDIRLQALRAQHPDTARVMREVALALERQGKYEEAELLYRRSLNLNETALGPRHPDTATGLNNLGAFLARQHRYGESEVYFRRAVAVRNEVLGPGHPDTVVSARNLAVALEYQGKHSEAESRFRRILQDEISQAPNPANARVATAHYYLGVNLSKQNKLDEAEQQLNQALQIQTELLGPGHADTRLTANALTTVRMDAQIRRQVEEFKKRPRKTFVGRAANARYTEYLAQWAARVEAVGNANYPDEARGKLYGSVRVVVTLRPDGSVQSAEIDRPSGYEVLDRAVLHIVQLASPFAPFPPEIRKDTDLLVITRTWYFSRGDKVASEAPSPR